MQPFIVVSFRTQNSKYISPLGLENSSALVLSLEDQDRRALEVDVAEQHRPRSDRPDRTEMKLEEQLHLYKQVKEILET